MIKFTDTFYFNNDWKQIPTVNTGIFATWRKGGFEDDCVLLETHRVSEDKYYVWLPVFISFSKNYSAMRRLDSLYHELYSNLSFQIEDIVKAKVHIDNFLTKASDMKIFL